MDFVDVYYVHFERFEEITALVSYPLQHVCVVVNLIQIVLVNYSTHFVEVSGDFVGLASHVLVSLDVALYLLVKVEDEVVENHGVFEGTQAFGKFLSEH